jgi:dTDP-4-amino-4,6-dideoxygalactose transaminase
MQNNKPIFLNPPELGREEQEMLLEVMASNWIATSGPHLELFEDMLSLFFNGRRVLLLNSGTSAIHLALKCLDIQPNDYVICADFTFCASANPIIYEQGIPVFVDIDPISLGICPKHLELAISSLDKKPKAIIVVHAYGMPANMHAIIAIAQKYNIPIIEDAAEALGSTYYQNQCGTLGDFGVISFNGNKIVTAGGGGALIFKNKSDYEKAYLLSIQGHSNGDYHYHVVGYNYRMTNIAAGIGIAQFKQLDKKVAKKRAIFDYYKSAFSVFPEILLQIEAANVFCNRWLTNIFIYDNKSYDWSTMKKDAMRNGIEVRPIWQPLHSQNIYNSVKYFGEGNAKHISKSGLSLPSGTSLNQEDQDRIVSCLLDLVKA